MKHFTQKAFIRHAFKMHALIMHALIMQTLQATLLSKLAITCLLITAGWLTFIGCAPVMDPVSKKAGDNKIADGGTPTPDPVVDPPAPVVIPTSTYLTVAGGGEIALSKDFGSSWQAIASGTTKGLSDIATDGTNIVSVSVDGTIAVRSTDKGETWSVVSTGISSGTTIELEYGNGVFSLMTYSLIAAPRYAFYRSTNGAVPLGRKVQSRVVCLPMSQPGTILLMMEAVF